MEVSLRKPEREVFTLMKKNEGSFVRKYKKSLLHTREYWRLMSKEYNPIKNITPSRMRQLFDLGIMEKTNDGEFALRQDAELAIKKPKNKKQ